MGPAGIAKLEPVACHGPASQATATLHLLPSADPRHRSPPAGLSPLDGLLHHLLTPAFAVPQALNVAGGVLFAASLRGASISLAAPVANGEA